jgi:hypothetical protein
MRQVFPSAHLTLACALVLAASSHARADADALVDLLGPREIAVGEAMRGGATGATAIGLNPAGLPLNHELVFEGGFGYRASDKASLVGVSACDSTGAMPGCFFYNYAGGDPQLDGMTYHHHTHTAGLALSRILSPRLFLGASLKYFRATSDVMGETTAKGFNWDAGLTAVLTPIVNVGVAGYNLWGDQAPQFPRAVGGGILARPIPALAVSFDARWKLDGDNSARYGGGLEFFPRSADNQSGYPLRAGVLHDGATSATYLSAGVGLSSMKYGIDLTARHQIHAGNETLFIASMRFFGPRVDTNADGAFGE